MQDSYTYAVARIRALEVSLFSNSTIEQLIGMPDFDSCLNFLEEKGWGEHGGSPKAKDIFATEEAKRVLASHEKIELPLFLRAFEEKDRLPAQ